MEKPNFAYKFFKKDACKNITLTQYGYHKWSAETKQTEALKESYVLHVVTGGKGYYRVRNKCIELSANKAFLLRPTERYEYSSRKDECLEYIWLGFDGEGVSDFLKASGFYENNYLLEVEETTTLSNILQEMLAHSAGEVPDYYLMSKMYAFLGCFLERLICTPRKKSLTASSNCSDIVAYIGENYKSKISISKMCKDLGMERSGLFKKFKKEFNISPQGYIIQYRLNLAENMITQTEMPINEIAEECGFNSYPYFSKKFKAKYCKTPSKYRKSKNTVGKEKP